MLLGIIGCGAIGSFLSELLPRAGFTISVVYDLDQSKTMKIAEKTGAKVARDFEEFLGHSMDLVIECASQEALKKYSEKIILSGRDLITLSIGAFADSEFYNKISKLCEKTGRKIYVAHAVAGLDAISAVADLIEEVEIESRKNRKILGDLNFEGDAFEAALKFPKSMNVALALSLAAKRIARVRLIASDEDENVHIIRVKWKYGEIESKVRNKTMENNPRTSVLAALSVVRILKNIQSAIVI